MKKILKLLQPELFFISLLMVLSILIIIVSLRYGFGVLRQPGPGLYPFFLGLFILPLSIALIISGLKSKSSEPLFTKSGLRTFLLMVITFCLWIIMMPVLGYVLVTFAVAFALCKIMKLEGWLKPLALSIATALFIYLLFDVWLYIDLPRGILGK
jgi:putative tricarboxylic transport membrane protein